MSDQISAVETTTSPTVTPQRADGPDLDTETVPAPDETADPVVAEEAPDGAEAPSAPEGLGESDGASSGSGGAGGARQAVRDHLARRYEAWLMGAALTVVYLVDSIAKYEREGSQLYDLGLFTAMIRQYSFFHAPDVYFDPATVNALGGHFSPVIAVVGPVFRVFPSPVTLLVCQALLVGASAVALAMTAADWIGRTAGAAVGLAYGLSFGVIGAIDADFHEVAFAPLFTVMALRKMAQHRFWAAAAWAVCLVAVQEEMGAAVVAPLGIAMFCYGARRLGAGLAVFGGLSSLALMKWVIPAINSVQHRYVFAGLDPLDGGGNSANAVLHGLSTDTSAKGLLLFLLVATSGLVALRSPLALLTVPDLAFRLASGTPGFFSTLYQYNLVIMPLLFLATADGVRRLRGSEVPLGRLLHQGGAFAALTATLALVPYFGLGAFRTWPDPQPMDSRISGLKAAYAAVPHGVTVEASSRLFPGLAAHDTMYWVGMPDGTAPPWIAYDQQDGAANTPDTSAGALTRAAHAHPGAAYEVVFAQDGFFVLRQIPSHTVPKHTAAKR
ncbi:MAG TPA: DUF2079 domain-containing protein [Actinocrinis sp.]